MAEAAIRGLPVQRPLFLHFEDDARTYAIQDAYLYGPDLLVAPVWQAAQDGMEHLSAGGRRVGPCLDRRGFAGGEEATCRAPFGQPPVFYRAGSEFAELFTGLRNL